MSERPVAELLGDLRQDPWREQVGFAPEVARANDLLLKPEIHATEARSVLNDWLQKYQPCLFGRIAAKTGLISYCVLDENDLRGSDDAILNKIQDARTLWTREGFEGRKSGFVILVVSPAIALGLPDKHMEELASKICSLYLLEPIQADQIYLDEVFLEIPGRERSTWRWHAGVNYFCAQGDKRWWQDHRIPGGMAFSVNSVGHMAKSGRLAIAMKDLHDLLGIPPEAGTTPKVESLPTALEFAMRTIAIASNAVSGKATELLPLPAKVAELPVRKCPVDLPAFLRDKNYCEYKGYYHTDHTLPSAYFASDVTRPASLAAHVLDFTYLFVNSAENPAFTTMGEGRRVRGGRLQEPTDRRDTVRTPKADAERLEIGNCERLRKALAK
jgi:hypothetical protein